MSKFSNAVDRALTGLSAVSTGVCPGCETCANAHGMSIPELSAAWKGGELADEPSFSWSPCDICGTRFGGNRDCWHAIASDDPAREIQHYHSACEDCVLYLANGDEPEDM